jgi:hypothetical protein
MPGLTGSRDRSPFCRAEGVIVDLNENARRKLIVLAPLFVGDTYAGYVDPSMEIPEQIPHYDRDKK